MTVLPFSRTWIASAMLTALPAAASAADAALTKAGLDFFEKKVRPVLTANCLSCHSEADKKRKGGLTLDTREGGLRGGDTGPAIVPGKPDQSLLIKAVRYTHKDIAMPPKNAGGKLADGVIKDLEHWVSIGAPDPRTGGGPTKPQKTYDTEAAKSWWSFQPVVAPAVPKVKDAAWPKTDVDKFVLAGLEGRDMKPAPDADALTLLRRVYFDLVGLPPTPEEIDAFRKDFAANPQAAYEAVVDKLLASPEFGRRWGRHWLDVARYAESSGRDVNVAFPHAWRYRDYVIDAFNADKPYDRFLREQIAGDLLPARDDRQKAEQIIATGFLALGAKSLNEMNARQFAVDLADEQIDTVSQAFLGTTIACARCHDHKFDPISQKEYTALAGIFLSTETKYGSSGSLGGRNAGPLADLPKGADLPIPGRSMTEAEHKMKKERLETLNAELKDAIANRMAVGKAEAKKDGGLNVVRIVAQTGQLKTELAAVNEDGSAKPLAMAVADKAASRPGFGGGAVGKRFGGAGLSGMFRRGSGFDSIADSPLFARGEIDKPGETVPRGFPKALTHGHAPAIKSGSGRKELADWLASPGNPLTARVMANRVWHWLMGRGVVASTDNFGTTGDKPANQPLLDHLATRFAADGWSVKKLVRTIVTSRTYRQAAIRDEESLAADPDNALFGRAEVRRLDAECLRDAMLAAAGLLDAKTQPGSMIAKHGDGPIGGPRLLGMSEDSILKADGNFRSVYLPIVRNAVPAVLEVFDFPDPSMVVGAREATNVPAQALFLLNGDFAARAARSLADRLLKTHAGDSEAVIDARTDLAYRLVLSRPAQADELSAARNFLARFADSQKTANKYSLGDAGAAWTSLCRALFAAADFRYVR